MPSGIERLAKHLDQREPVTVEMDAGVCFALIGTLQLALRHPANQGPTSELMRGFCDDLIVTLASGDDSIENFLRRGDDPHFDVYHKN